MHLNHYELITEATFTSFQFISEGRKGRIIKIIEFQKMNGFINMYNLAFGDKNLDTGEFDDKIVTDNGDSEKVLTTVLAALYDFLAKNPKAWIYVTGSTPPRTRLYRMGINKYLDIAIKDFDIMGEFENKWELYKKDKDYYAFVARRKNN